jgi:D-galacturonate reductase
MKYTPSDGKFCGQQGYGYKSLEAMVAAAAGVNGGSLRLSDCGEVLATAAETLRGTAVLEAGRKSLDRGGPVDILYEDPAHPCRPSALL